MGVVDARHPVAHGLVHGVLQRLASGLHGDHLRTKELHAGDVQRLTVGVDAAHVDPALHAEQGCCRCRRDAVLPGAGLGDDPGLAHAPREQCLAEHVVDLVRAGVVEVLALQQDAGVAAVLAEPLRVGEGRRPAGVVAAQVVELVPEGLVRHRLVELSLELVQGSHQRLWDVAATEDVVMTGGIRQRSTHTDIHSYSQPRVIPLPAARPLLPADPRAGRGAPPRGRRQLRPTASVPRRPR